MRPPRLETAAVVGRNVAPAIDAGTRREAEDAADRLVEADNRTPVRRGDPEMPDTEDVAPDLTDPIDAACLGN